MMGESCSDTRRGYVSRCRLLDDYDLRQGGEADPFTDSIARQVPAVLVITHPGVQTAL